MFTFQSSLLEKIISSKRKELVEIAKSYHIQSTKRQNMTKIILKIMKAFNKKVVNSTHPKGKLRVIEIKSFKKIISKNKRSLVDIANKTKLENVKSMTTKMLKKELIISQSKKYNITSIGAPFFEQIGAEWIYNDPHFLGKSIDYLSILLMKTSSDTAFLILSFLEKPKNNVPVYEWKTGLSIGKPHLEKEIEKEKELHETHDHACTFGKCINKFKKSHLYRREYHQFDYEYETSYFSKNYHPGLVKGHLTDVFDVWGLENKLVTKFNLVDGWYNKVVTIKSGNCLKDSLFKMRELIIKKYSDLLPFIKFGAVNNKKEFKRLANSIDDHDIESLQYFNFLLSTASVMFINTEGEIVYSSETKFDQYIPSFYTCFFLIEANNDGVTGHVSPINFGILKSNQIPYKRYLTTIKKLYGKEPSLKGTKQVKDYVGKPWKKTYFFQYLSEHCVFKMDQNELVKSSTFLQRIKNKKGTGIDYLVSEPFTPHEKDIFDNSEVQAFMRLETDHTQVSLKENNETVVVTGFAKIISNILKNKHSSQYLEFLDQHPEKNMKNEKIAKRGNINTLRYNEENANILPKKSLKSHMIEAFTNDYFTEMNIDSDDEKERINANSAFETNLAGKRLDGAVCYNHMNIDKKNCPFNSSQYSVVLLVEFKDIGALHLESISQGIWYHLFLKLKCDYVLISTLYNNIIFKHKILSNKKHEYSLIYNDTIYLSKGFRHFDIITHFGFNFDGKPLSSKGFEKSWETRNLIFEKEKKNITFNLPHTYAVENKIDVYGALNDVAIKKSNFILIKSLSIIIQIIKKGYDDVHLLYGPHQIAVEQKTKSNYVRFDPQKLKIWKPIDTTYNIKLSLSDDDDNNEDKWGALGPDDIDDSDDPRYHTSDWEYRTADECEISDYEEKRMQHISNYEDNIDPRMIGLWDYVDQMMYRKIKVYDGYGKRKTVKKEKLKLLEDLKENELQAYLKYEWIEKADFEQIQQSRKNK